MLLLCTLIGAIGALSNAKGDGYMKAFTTNSSILICFLSLPSFDVLAEDERVFKNGDYWEISSIRIVGGQWLNYVKHLSTKWRDLQDFTNSKG